MATANRSRAALPTAESLHRLKGRRVVVFPDVRAFDGVNCPVIILRMAKTPAESAKPLPRCKAILLCERAIVEEGTRKTSLIGIFHSFNVASFPSRTAGFALFLELVGGLGSYDLRIELHDLNEGEVVARTPSKTVTFTDRIAARKLIFPLRGIHIGHAGAYDLVVLAGSEEIDRQRFTVHGPREDE